MIDVIAKVVEASEKTMEKLGQSMDSVKDALGKLDKPLNSEKIDSLKDSGSSKNTLSDLDKPLTEKVCKYDDEGFRTVTGEEKQGLKEKFGWSDKALDKCKINDETKTIKYPCNNEELAGKLHPKTGVPFEKSIIEMKGQKIEVVKADFNPKFETQLPEDKLQLSDREQFKACNEKLLERIEGDSKFAGQFSNKQLAQIKMGGKPEGYTWHHDVEAGKMQLVDTKTHSGTNHTGGKTIWGGGNENR